MDVAEKSEQANSVTFGFSLDRITVERIDALLGVAPRKRSARYRELVIAGMADRYGADWAEKADVLRVSRIEEGAAA